ncbi:hypothetical protein BDN72DRAFT_905673 [Pluteus cervinus]|uniref:Uncharacterized protein n=1 Tax=Pluteus cervinus TaxID=181527 RepID=A0ACD3A1R8_9AGAR|nr:hypothetical protein BDN72DRAFT_905673 [Pluteus cervinus]
MASKRGGRKEKKIQTRQQRFYARNKERLREEARKRMALIRAARRTSGPKMRRIILVDESDPTFLTGRTSVDADISAFDSGVDDGFETYATSGHENRRQAIAPFDLFVLTDPRHSRTSNTETPSRLISATTLLGVEGAIEDEVNRLTPFSEIDHFGDASRAIHGWLAEWGGLESWPHFLDVGFQTARMSGHTDEWVQLVVDHADRGRLLERLLGQMETTLPLEMWKIRELWRQQTQLLGLVVKALTLIEVRVDVLKNGWFNLIQ